MVREAFCTEAFLARHAGLRERVERESWPVWVVPEGVMRGLATTEHSQGVLCVAEQPPGTGEPRVEPGFLAVALDGVGDPGNVGSALRAAHAAGASLVALGPGCCDRFNAKAARASAGGVFVVPAMATADLGQLLGKLRAEGVRVVVADAGAGRLLWEADLRGPVALVVGAEARGVGEAARALAHDIVAILMPGGAESLNAAATVGVLLYEALRQREGAQN
jgi:tRNA G18 (ribose-2'-O)-methylase SpoU